MGEKVKQIFYVVKSSFGEWITTQDPFYAERFADMACGWVEMIEKDINYEETHFIRDPADKF